jgi:hypothetical protein
VAAAQAQLDNLRAGPDQNQRGFAQASLSASSAQRDATAAQLDKLLSGPSQAELAQVQ